MHLDTILIIEDDEISSKLLQFLIEDVLHTKTITVKEDGEDALTYLEALIDNPVRFPQLIFLDLNMPNISGYDFMDIYEEKFAKHFPESQLVVLTSSVRKKDQEALLNYPSVVRFINKPLREAQLKEIKTSIEHK